jgi:hypothetical protein
LLVLVSGGCEGGARQLLGIEAIRRFLGRVCSDGQGALYGFRPVWVLMS